MKGDWNMVLAAILQACCARVLHTGCVVVALAPILVKRFWSRCFVNLKFWWADLYDIPLKGGTRKKSIETRISTK